jgi:hypothetical protein
MKPEIWGKYGWTFFHFVTLGYPDNPTIQDKENYYVWIDHLKYVLPCDNCKQNLKTHIKKYPLTETALMSRSNLVKWGIDLHNVVNYYTGKPMLSYDSALNDLNKLNKSDWNQSTGLYTGSSPSWTNKYGTYVFWLIVGIIIVAGLYYILAKKN